LTPPNRRLTVVPADRRRFARGGRRESDCSGRHPTVLVADAYDNARVPIARYLNRFGFHVVEASNASEAVVLMNLHRPLVILSGLLGAEGALFHSQLSSVPTAVPSVVIVLTSSLDDPVPTDATGVLTKPFLLRAMLDELRREVRALAARGAV
jgi:CheY-like chemotaxis protein